MLAEPICSDGERNCKWYDGIKNTTKEEKNERHVCKAFPDGIPKEILTGKNLHEEVMTGQQGDYVYEEA